MEYYLFLILAGMLLSILFIGIGVICGGFSEGTHNRHSGDCIYSNRVLDGCDSDLGERDGSEHCRQAHNIDNETAVIALKMIKRDMNEMLSGTEKKAIDYAVFKIEDRYKPQTDPEEIEQLAKKLNVKLLGE